MPSDEQDDLVDKDSNIGVESEETPLPDYIIGVPRQFLAIIVLIYGLIVGGAVAVLRVPFFYGLAIALLLVIPLWMYGKSRTAKKPTWFKGDK